MSTRIISLGLKRPVRKADNLTSILCRCHVIWNLNFLEPSGPLQASNWTAFPFLILSQKQYYPHNMSIQISPNSSHTLYCAKDFLYIYFHKFCPFVIMEISAGWETNNFAHVCYVLTLNLLTWKIW